MGGRSRVTASCGGPSLGGGAAEAAGLLDVRAGSQVFREGAGACEVVSGLLDQPSGVLPELYLPAECADPQDLRAELRDGAAESDCRQGDADLRLSQTQAAAGKVLYDVGENRPRTSRAASLRQGCGGEDVCEVLDVSAGGAVCEPDEGPAIQQRLGESEASAADSDRSQRSIRQL